MHIEDLTEKLEVIFSLPIESVKEFVKYKEDYLIYLEKYYAQVKNRVRARIERGTAKRMISKDEIYILEDYPQRIVDHKILIRAIKEGMAYRSMA